jgi:hypothetical protein
MMTRAVCYLLPTWSILALAGGCASHRATHELSVDSTRFCRPKHYTCHRASGAIVVDGRLDESAWESAPWTGLFVDIEGEAKPPPRYGTRAKMLWDQDYLYISAALEEPHVWGTLTDHDQVVFYDNDFEVFIDPDGDEREYYEIEVNALNTVFDLLLVRTYRDGGPALHEWDLKGLKTAVQVNGTLNDPSDVDAGWSVELALPWSSLAQYAHRPAPPGEGDTWRMNFSRVEWQHRVVDGRYEKVPDVPEDNWVWSPQGEIDMHIPGRWGSVQFAGPATKGRPGSGI